jgi:K+-sensing histidine kinase KdpD
MAERQPGERLLRIASTSSEGGAVRIEICDNGHGVADPEAIFAPFFSTKNGGIGLGLAICRTIIASHRGRLWASNNATGGATLHIWMPRTGDESLAMSDAEVASDTEVASGQGMIFCDANAPIGLIPGPFPGPRS